MIKKALFALVYFLFFQNILFAEPTFPELTGRVVDNAQILTTSQKSTLSSILENHEKETSNQIVIVTLKSLADYDIADYGYQLGRYWKIGQENKNNGILLIISMSDKKIRIEVGYGLEGSLTDKTSHEIIEYIIKPEFRTSNFYNGIKKATDAIIKAIKGEYKASDYGVLEKDSENWFFVYFIIIFISMIVGSAVRKYKNNTISKVFHSTMLGGFGGAFAIGFFQSLIISAGVFSLIAVLVFIFTKKISFSNTKSNSSRAWGSSNNSGFGGGFSSGGGFGGGFSGGGGSFGGGGASGGW